MCFSLFYSLTSLFFLTSNFSILLILYRYNFNLYLYTKGISQHTWNLGVMSNFSITLAYSWRSKKCGISQEFQNTIASTALEHYMILEYESNLCQKTLYNISIGDKMFLLQREYAHISSGNIFAPTINNLLTEIHISTCYNNKLISSDICMYVLFTSVPISVVYLSL